MNNVKLYIQIDTEYQTPDFINSDIIYIKTAKIDEIELDVYQSEDLTPLIVKQSFEIDNPESKVGDYTLGLTLPATDRNNKAFNFLNELQNGKSFYEQKKYQARIEVNSQTILSGTLYVLSCSEINYECTLIGINISWVDLLKNKQLTEINLDPILYTGPISATDGFPSGNNNAPNNSVSLLQIMSTFENREPVNYIPGWDTPTNFQFYTPFISYGNFYNITEIELVCTTDTNNNQYVITSIDNLYAVQNQLMNGMYLDSDTISYGTRYINYRVVGNDIFLDLRQSSQLAPVIKSTVDAKIRFFIQHPKAKLEPIELLGGSNYTNYILNGEYVNTNFNLYSPSNKYRIDNLSYKDFPFAPYVKSMIKQIFKDINYSVGGTFISDINTDDLLIPFTKDDFTYKSIINGVEITNGVYGNVLNQSTFTSISPVDPINFNFTNSKTISDYVEVFPRNIISSFSDKNGINYFIFPSFRNKPIDNLSDFKFNVYETFQNTVFPLYKYISYDSNKIIDTSIEIKFDYKIDNILYKDFINNNNFNFVLFLYKSEEDIINIDFSDYKIEDFLYSNTPITVDDNLLYYELLNAEDLNVKTFEKTFDISINNLEKLYIILAYVDETKVPLNQFFFKTKSLNVNNFRIWWYPNYDLTTGLLKKEAYTVPSHFLPDDFTQSEFIREIIRLFNLQIELDINNKIIYFNYYKDYFLNAETAVDWTDKCNIKTAVIKPTKMVKEYNFNYTLDEEDLYFNPLNQFNYKRLSNSKYYEGISNIESKFSPTGNREIDFLLNGYKLKIPAIGKLEDYNKTIKDSSDINYSSNIRILQSIGLTELIWVSPTGSITGDLNIPNFGQGLTVNGREYKLNDNPVFPLAFFDFRNINPTGGELDSIKKVGNFYPNIINFNWNDEEDGLYKKYWKKNIEYIEKTNVIELQVQLSITDMINLNVRRPVRIGKHLFYIQNIDRFNPATEAPVKVSLVKKL